MKVTLLGLRKPKRKFNSLRVLRELTDDFNLSEARDMVFGRIAHGLEVPITMKDDDLLSRLSTLGEWFYYRQANPKPSQLKLYLVTSNYDLHSSLVLASTPEIAKQAVMRRIHRGPQHARTPEYVQTLQVHEIVGPFADGQIL